MKMKIKDGGNIREQGMLGYKLINAFKVRLLKLNSEFSTLAE